jgi:hypothetical protein
MVATVNSKGAGNSIFRLLLSLALFISLPQGNHKGNTAAVMIIKYGFQISQSLVRNLVFKTLP